MQTMEKRAGTGISIFFRDRHFNFFQGQAFQFFQGQAFQFFETSLPWFQFLGTGISIFFETSLGLCRPWKRGQRGKEGERKGTTKGGQNLI